MGYFKNLEINHAEQMVFDEWYKVNGDNLYREWTDLVNGTHADGPTFDEYVDSCYEQFCYPTSNKIPV